MCFFLEKDILADTLEAGWAKQEKGEMKGENTGRKSIVFCMKAFTLRRNKKNRKLVTEQGDWILFVYSREGWNSSLYRPGQHCGLMERTPMWGAVPQLHFCPYVLSPATSYIHPWAQDVRETEVTTSRCQTCAQSQQLPSCRHCQEAFLLAFFKATPDWYRSFTALCFLSHIFLQLSLLPLLIAGSLLFRHRGGLAPFGSLGIQNDDMFVTFVNRSRSKETVLLTAPWEMMPQWQASF